MERVSLAGPRGAFREALGRFFAIADLFVHGPNEVDARAFEALKLKQRDLTNDEALDGVLDGLAKGIDRSAAELAAVGFSNAMRDQLLKAGAEFHAAYTLRPLLSGENKVKTDARDAHFARLRGLTNWFRRTGRTALRNDKSRTDFDRVKMGARKKAKKPVPAPVPAQSAPSQKTG